MSGRIPSKLLAAGLISVFIAGCTESGSVGPGSDAGYVTQPTAYTGAYGTLPAPYQSAPPADFYQTPGLLKGLSAPPVEAGPQFTGSRNFGSRLPAADYQRRLVNAVAKVRMSEPKEGQRLDRFYARRNAQPVWFASQRWTPQAEEALKLLHNSLDDGLPPQRYLGEGLSLGGETDADEVVRKEFWLTFAFSTFLADQRDGLLGENQSGDGLVLLEQALRAESLTDFAEANAPANAPYQRLKAAMRQSELTPQQRGTVMVNMERFRRYKTPEPSRFVWVNLPTYQLKAHENNQVALSSPVIIGQEARRTPVMEDRITDLKWSPDWNVPQLVVREDLIPWLKERGTAFIKDWDLVVQLNGQPIDPFAHDWAKADPKKNSYTFYQRPGPRNALGGVRFSLANPYAIYMHDSPDKELFTVDEKTLSSGCVRVLEAARLAEWILKDEKDWSRDKINKLMRSRKTEVHPLKKPMPIYFRYYTAYVDEVGQLHFGDDIYGEDLKLARAMRF